MSTLLRVFGAILIVCIAVLGLGFVSGYLSEEFLSQNALKLGMSLGLLLVAVVALKLLSSGRGSSSETEPPPTL